LAVIDHPNVLLPPAPVRFCPALSLNGENSVFTDNNVINVEFVVKLEVVIDPITVKHKLIKFLPDRPFPIKAKIQILTVAKKTIEPQ